MTEYSFTVVIEQDEDGWYIAHVPALQGCHTQGETEAEAYALIEDAIRLHIGGGSGAARGQQQHHQDRGLTTSPGDTAGGGRPSRVAKYPWQESNLRIPLRRRTLYPLSYRGGSTPHPTGHRGRLHPRGLHGQ